MKLDLQISPEIRAKCPGLALGALLAEVQISTDNSLLQEQISQGLAQFEEVLQMQDIKLRPAIAATRQAYKACGKDPGRYRPSAEALCRRIVNRKGLYQVNNVVDLLNLVSIRSGHSIGGWDASQIQGTAILGVGREAEPYEAIGRGELNIEGLPVFRDGVGAFGTPTSDSVRTMVQAQTHRFLMVFYAFSGSEGLQDWLDMSSELLLRFAEARQIQNQIII